MTLRPVARIGRTGYTGGSPPTSSAISSCAAPTVHLRIIIICDHLHPRIDISVPLKGTPECDCGSRQIIMCGVCARAGGRTWGDVTQICPALNPHESNLAVGRGRWRYFHTPVYFLERITSAPEEIILKKIMYFRNVQGGASMPLLPGGRWTPTTRAICCAWHAASAR